MGENTYGFAPDPQPEIDVAGAHSLDEAYRQAFSREQHQAQQEYQRLHYELERAHLQRQLEHDRAQTEQRLRYEALMTDAIPKLYAIDPADPKANEKRAAIAKDYPQLFHSETGIPSISKEFEQHQRLSESSARQREAEQARKDLKDTAREQAEASKKLIESSGGKATSATVGGITYEMPTKTAAKEEAAKAKLLASPAVQTAYQKASRTADDIGARLEQNRKFIEEQQAKGDKIDDESKGHLEKMLRSSDQLKSQYDRAVGTKEALELVHPELSSNFKSESPVTSGAIETASPDVPAIRNTAPVSSGTATPSGEMNTTRSGAEDLAAVKAAQAEPVAQPTDIPPENPNLIPDVGAQVEPPAEAVVAAQTPDAVATPAPHPYEGKLVRQKSTGKMGTFTNGVFTPQG